MGNPKTFYIIENCFVVADEVQFDQLTDKLSAKNHELKLCVFLVEHCLYLLWAHLDYYMLHASKAHSTHLNAASHMFNQQCRFFKLNFWYLKNTNNNVLFFPLKTASLNGTDPNNAWRVTTEDVGQLKKSLNHVLNETFCKQLVATSTQSESNVDREFVAALLRRIKRLIQFAPTQ